MNFVYYRITRDNRARPGGRKIFKKNNSPTASVGSKKINDTKRRRNRRPFCDGMTSKHGALLSAVHCGLYGAELARNRFGRNINRMQCGVFRQGTAQCNSKNDHGNRCLYYVGE